MRPCVPRMLPATPADYLMQTKYDGWNVVIADGHVWTRHGKEITHWCSDWGFELAPPTPINGELQALEEGRLASRADIQGIRTGRCRAIVRAFDVMCEGPGLEQRLQMLREHATGAMTMASTVDPVLEGKDWADVNDWLAAVKADGHEGLVLKRRGSLYLPGREASIISDDWLKLKVPVACPG